MRKLAYMSAMVFCVLWFPVEKTAGQDFAVLELLVNYHKTHSDKLKERAAQDAGKYGISMAENGIAEKYTDVAGKVNGRMFALDSAFSFVTELACITVLAKEVWDMEIDAAKLGVSAAAYDPRITIRLAGLQKECLGSEKKIAEITAFLMASSLGIVAGTLQQRKEFARILSNELYSMRSKLYGFISYARWAKAVGTPGGLGWEEKSKKLYDASRQEQILDGIKKEIDLLGRGDG